MIAIFPSALGVRQGTRDAADEFHRAGHEVHIVDIFEGRTFDTYPPAMAFAWEELGQAEMLRRALAGVTGLADGFAATGFSLGCMLAAYVATQERVDAAFAERDAWHAAAVRNVAAMGPFSSDRTIREYAEGIWGVQPLAL